LGGKSNAFENLILAHTLGAVTFAAPGTVWAGLWTTTLDDTSTGATAGEVSGGSYARVAITNNQTNWPAPSGGTVKNGVAITFPAATADWGTITHCSVLNAASAGTILYWAALTASKIVQNGDTAQFAIDAFVVTED